MSSRTLRPVLNRTTIVSLGGTRVKEQVACALVSIMSEREFDDIFGMPRSGGSVEYLQISRALPGSAVAGDATRAKDGGGDQNNGVALATESRRESHDENPEQEDQPQRVQGEVIVGFAFMAKKMDSMSKIVAITPCDGVEFCQLDFSKPPEQHRRMDVILHKLSDDIMSRDVAPEGDRRLRWIEEFLKQNPETAIVDSISHVAKVINRVSMLELLDEANRKYGAAGGMPRPPRFLVLEGKTQALESKEGGDVHAHGEEDGGASSADRTGDVPGVRGAPSPAAPSRRGGIGDLQFPVICKPIKASGTRGSHTMTVVLDESGMADVSTPIVVQEFCDHGGILYKVSVVGDDVRVFTRTSLPDLRSRGLKGSFTFDSQKPFPTLAEVETVSAGVSHPRQQHYDDEPPQQDAHDEWLSSKVNLDGLTLDRGVDSPSVATTVPTQVQCEISQSSSALFEGSPTAKIGLPSPAVESARVSEAQVRAKDAVSVGIARRAAAHLHATFGLSMYGFDLIVDSDSGEIVVIDVNYFPSFKDLDDFPEVLRRRLTDVAAEARSCNRRSSLVPR